MKKRTSLIALMLAAMMLFCTACSPGNGDTPSDGEPGNTGGGSGESVTLNIGTLEPTDTFDPTVATFNMGPVMVYDTLFVRDYSGTGEIKGNLVSEWEYTDDTTLVMTLRDDVYFSNGEKLQASDALYSLKRFLTNDQFLTDSGFDNIDFDNSVAEGNTLTLKLYQPSALLIGQMAGLWGSVVCESYVEANPDSFWDAPVGTGPYVLVENVSGSHSSYARNENYWGEAPVPDVVNIYNYSESTTMFIDFENGAIDIAVNIAATDADRLINGEVDANYKLMLTNDIDCITLPEYVEAFDDIRVRQAIAYALDTEAIAQAAYGSMAQVATSVVPSSLDFFDSSIPANEYDPDKARELLAEAGYNDGELELLMVVFSVPVKQTIAEVVQAQLREVGITVNIEAYDPPTAIPIFMQGGVDINLGGTNGGMWDPALIFNHASQDTTNLPMRITDEHFNELLETAKYTTDDAVREECYIEAQNWLHDSYRWIMIDYTQACTAYSKDIAEVYGFDFKTVDPRYVVYN